MIGNLNPSIRALIIDLDGVLWREDQQIGDLSKIFSRIETLNLKFTLVSNNSTRSASQYVEKLDHYGVRISQEQIINSALAATFMLKERFPEGGPVYIIGEIGLRETLAVHGFHHADKDVRCVVAGLDRFVTYKKLRDATILIRGGAPFIGTNPDPSLPTPEGLIPGAGSILAAIEIATDIKPTIAGKPYPFMMQKALVQMGTTAAETLVIGDRLDTDILGGINTGCKTALVLSGVSTEQDLLECRNKPDLVAENLESILN